MRQLLTPVRIGRYIAPNRLAALNAPDRNTFFAPPTAKGYIDYPALAVAEAA